MMRVAPTFRKIRGSSPLRIPGIQAIRRIPGSEAPAELESKTKAHYERSIALWPPMLSTRERLTFGEVSTHMIRPVSDIDRVLASHVPTEDRFWCYTTYGKAAFELAVRSASLAGSKIILPAFISHDFVGVFQKHNITPIFVDVDPHTWQLDPTTVEPAVVPNAASIVLLHTFGLPADGRAFRELSDRQGLILIEDCARALGAWGSDGLVGSHGDFAAFSLSKVAPTSRGGLLVARTPIPEIRDRGRTTISGFAHSMALLKVPGMKVLEGPLYRLARETPVYQREVGLYDPPAIECPERMVSLAFEAFLPSYASALRRKREIGLEIRWRLEPLGFQFQSDPGNHIYTAIGAIVPEFVDRRAMRDHLRSRAINAYTLWGDPLGISQTATAAWGTDRDAFPITALLANRLLHFPINRFMTSQDVDRLVSACAESLRAHPA